MKYTLQKCFAFLMIIFIFGLYSCEKDLYEENIQNSSRKIIMRNFSIKELNNKSSKLFNTITNIKKSIEKNNLDGRLVYDSINNFYFDDEKGIYLDDGISKSYVFKVERSNGNDKIEKLVFSLKQNGDYKILLAKYDFNANELEVLTKQQLEQKEVKFEDITNPINRVALMTCVMNYSCVDNGELHGADSPATCAWVLTSFDCSLGSTAGGGGGGESGSGSGGINAGHYGTYSGDNGPGGSGDRKSVV